MSASPPPRQKQIPDRRAPPGRRGLRYALRWLKGLLGRPMGLEWRGRQLHVVIVDRRRKPRADLPLTLSQMRAELRARLIAHEHDNAARLMRHLVFVHDELGRKGWAGIGKLPARLLGKALVQAEMLNTEEPSAALAMVVDTLRPLHVAAEMRQAHAGGEPDLGADSRPEVSEATHEEYELMERSWVGTIPGGLSLPERSVSGA